jgi:hypothetical protein
VQAARLKIKINPSTSSEPKVVRNTAAGSVPYQKTKSTTASELKLESRPPKRSEPRNGTKSNVVSEPKSTRNPRAWSLP